VHRQLYLLAFKIGSFRVELHEFDSLVVAAGGHQIAHGSPRHAVDGALVMPCPLEQHCRLIGGVVLSEVRELGVSAYPQGLGVGADSIEGAAGVELGTSHSLDVLQRRDRHEPRSTAAVLLVH